MLYISRLDHNKQVLREAKKMVWTWLARAVTLSGPQLQEAIHIGQIWDDHCNVPPPILSKEDKGTKPVPWVDLWFRDDYNNIINLGQVFQFTKLPYWWFLSERYPPNFWIDPPPTKLKLNPKQHNVRMKITPIGILTDETPPQMHRNKSIIRAGRLAMVRPAGDSYNTCDEFGSWVNEKNIYFFQGMQNRDIWRELAQASLTAYWEAVNDAREKVTTEYETWRTLQQDWEWKLFQDARNNFHNLQWPHGTIVDSISALGRDDVITEMPVLATAVRPIIVPSATTG